MVMLQQSLKKCVSRKLLGTAVTLDEYSCEPRNVLAVGLLLYIARRRASLWSEVHVMSGNYLLSKIRKMEVVF